MESKGSEYIIQIERHKTSDKNAIDKSAIARAFNRAAKTYDSVALLQREIGTRLLERLDDIEQIYHQECKFNPNTILDLGGGTGFFSRELNQKWKNSNVINFDISFEMLTVSQESREVGLNKVPFHLCADAEFLPISSNSIDFIFSNCTLQWCRDYPRLFHELYRILKPKGILLFSSFGPDTLMELRECFSTLDEGQHVNDFMDMHVIGDTMHGAKFSYPVMDREMIVITFPSVNNLMKDLKLMGANYVHRKSDTGALTREKLNKLSLAYEQFRNKDGVIPASFEVIFGYGVKS